jgi:hypothetical protein
MRLAVGAPLDGRAGHAKPRCQFVHVARMVWTPLDIGGADHAHLVRRELRRHSVFLTAIIRAEFALRLWHDNVR